MKPEKQKASRTKNFQGNRQQSQSMNEPNGKSYELDALSIIKSGIGILPVNAFEQQKHRLEAPEAYATSGKPLKLSFEEPLVFGLDI